MKGKVLSYTVLHIVPDGFNSPLYLAIVKTSEDKLLVYTEEKGMKIGKRVKITRQGDYFYARSLKILDYFKK